MADRQTVALYKVVWTDGYARDAVAQRVVAENLQEAVANALCETMRDNIVDESDWYIVLDQDKPIWRGMAELV